MKKWTIVFLLFIVLCISLYFILFSVTRKEDKSFISGLIPPKPLEKYTFENLRKKQFVPSIISLGRPLIEQDEFTSQLFYFDSDSKKISGLFNVPTPEGVYPVIIMLRGFVAKEIYDIGIGTKRGGEFFAQNGFITLSPDFLGYGESDNPSRDAIEERFQTYTTTLSLLSSLENLNNALDASYSGRIRADTTKVGIWGHSNGGQIALSVLSITGKNYPTVLWAPVSKPFPYSILYFTDEFDDYGKALRKVVANFEKDYDVELYSPTNYFSWINSPIQIHQGIDDDAVPKKWSDQLAEKLEVLKKDLQYFVYPNADHNLMPASPQGGPDGWNTAIQRSLNFFKIYL